MKTKLVGILSAFVLSIGSSSAVTLQTNIFANTSNNIGLVTTLVGGLKTSVTGLAFLYSSSTVLTSGDVAAVTTRSGFEALISSTPGAIRSSLAVTSGALSSTGQSELGAVGNSLYLWLQSTDGSSYGLFKAANVPSLGTVSVTSASTSDLIGTSVFASAVAGPPAQPASGFQLVSAVPEPSAALLGAVGALGLLRRRRN